MYVSMRDTRVYAAVRTRTAHSAAQAALGLYCSVRTVKLVDGSGGGISGTHLPPVCITVTVTWVTWDLCQQAGCWVVVKDHIITYL